MKKLNLTIVFTVGLLLSFTLFAIADKNKPKSSKENVTKPAQKEEQKPAPTIIKQSIPEEKEISEIKPAAKEETSLPEMKQIDIAPQQNYELPWVSINAGGDISMSSDNYKMKASTGQSAIGLSQSDNYKMGIGFWYGTAPPCVEAVVGDLALPLNGQRTPADVVTLINIVFRSRPFPVGVNPCAGDVNKSGGVPSPSDVVTLINNVFRNKPLPAEESCGC